MSDTKTELYQIVDDAPDRALLVGVDRSRSTGWSIEEDLAELERLADTAGARVVDTVTQRMERPDGRTFIGSGKVEEVALRAAENDANLVIFDEELTPSQQSNLETQLPNVRVIDRTALILEIFALHAMSREGKLQVELARLEYMLPRLRGMWGHLEKERLGGGRGARFGAGESQLETDRRLARRRISELKRELKTVSKYRETQRHSRADSGIMRIALVGYTNAGKSTILNALTNAGVLVEDKLFATLDATTRRLDLPEGREVTLTDTVGFINKLPHGLVDAFKSTLDEVREADLQLHIVDASDPQAKAQLAAVHEVLGEIEATGRPQMLVYNKCDLLADDDLTRLRRSSPNAVCVSGATGMGLADLLEHISAEASRSEETFEVLVPYTRGELVRLAHERAHIISEEHTGEGTHLVLKASASIAAQFASVKQDDAAK
ncbi:MAG: GTPase HflX [Actinobacteria bacterium HGW-Actinobacteria-6]|jgi:GTP-binding protein HflX|nr:MAG: GTPase HflX [Actinobacteria bacterium HGW-Actinobacteria-6]